MMQITVSVKQACRMVGLSRATLYRAIKSKELVAYKVGTRTLLRTRDLTAFVERTKMAA